ncbi:MAG TPA: hypothetical protein VGV61_00670 [Thermoanaerobaculia bacterium]|nr:hypothetical protein [Thermoanaerobaculia bacterium]
MKRRWWVGGVLMLLLLAGAAPGAARDHGYRNGRYRSDRYTPDNSVRLRLGLFTPDGKSDYFRDAERDFTGNAKDLEDIVGGLDWVHQFQGPLGFMLSADFFQGKNDQSYRNFTDNRGREIVHTTTLEITPVTAGLVFQLAPERSPVIPYVGAGGGVYAWKLRESGDFIDFTTPQREIFTDTNQDDGAALGYYVLAGLEVPIGSYFSFFAEGRWDRADDKLSKDLAGLGTVDLSGRRVTGGVAWHF